MAKTRKRTKATPAADSELKTLLASVQRTLLAADTAAADLRKAQAALTSTAATARKVKVAQVQAADRARQRAEMAYQQAIDDANGTEQRAVAEAKTAVDAAARALDAAQEAAAPFVKDLRARTERG